MLHAEERAEHIGIERRGVAVGGLLRHRAGLAFGAGVVDGSIEPTEARDGLIDQARAHRPHGDVGADELGFGAELAQLSGQCLAGVLMAAGDDEPVAFLAKARAAARPIPVSAPVIKTTGVLISLAP